MKHQNRTVGTVDDESVLAAPRSAFPRDSELRAKKGSDQIAVEIQHKGGPVFLVGPERSCERVAPPMQATVFKAAPKKRSNGVYFGALKTIVSRALYSQLTSSKTDVIIDTWP